MTLLLQGAGAGAVNGAPIDPATVAGLVAWYKADALVLADGAAVASWTNSKSGGAALEQAPGAQQPVYTAVDTNGRPGVLFDGVNDFMNASFTVGTTRTLFVVGRWNTATLNRAMLDGFSATNQLHIDSADSSTVHVQSNVGLGSGVVTTPTAPHCYTLRILPSAGAVPVLRVDSDDSSPTQDWAGASSPGGLYVGSVRSESAFAHCTINEILLYNTDVAPADRVAVQSYLKGKWGTP